MSEDMGTRKAAFHAAKKSFDMLSADT